MSSSRDPNEAGRLQTTSNLAGSGRSLAVVAGAWLVFSVVNATQVYISMLEHGHSYPRMLAFNIAVWGLWALLTPAVGALARRWPLVPFSLGAMVVHLLAALLVGMAHVAAWVELTVLIRPYDAMGIQRFGAADFVQALWYRLQFEIVVYAVVVVLSTAAEAMRRLHRRELEAERLEAQLAQARLHTLELQLRPHFLFNTLHTVTGFVRADRNREAVEMIVRLSDLLHQTLEVERRPLIPLERELAMFDAYVAIERQRFADRLTVSVEVDPRAQQALIPPFVVQPLAENAMRHGIARVAGAVSLRLLVRVHAERLAAERLDIELFNSGPALATGPPGIGLTNTRERLRQVWGDAARLDLADVAGGVVARLSVPLVTDE